MRIENTSGHSTQIRRGKIIPVIINGKNVSAFEGELVSTVLLAEGIRTLHLNPLNQRESGLYCMMGFCYQCLVTVDGVKNMRACQTYIHDGMEIETETVESE